MTESKIGLANKRLKIVLSKKGGMKYISHLDLVRTLQRASRRAGLPFAVTQGYSPHLKISLKRALKLGVESEAEEGIFYMAETIRGEEFSRRMNAKLPEGIKILSAEEI